VQRIVLLPCRFQSSFDSGSQPPTRLRFAVQGSSLPEARDPDRRENRYRWPSRSPNRTVPQQLPNRHRARAELLVRNLVRGPSLSQRWRDTKVSLVSTYGISAASRSAAALPRPAP